MIAFIWFEVRELACVILYVNTDSSSAISIVIDNTIFLLIERLMLFIYRLLIILIIIVETIAYFLCLHLV